MRLHSAGTGKKPERRGEFAYKNEETKGVVKGTGALFSFNCRNDGETAWGESNGECDPEPSVRGQSGSAKSIPNSHLPRNHSIQQQQISSPQLTYPAILIFRFYAKKKKKNEQDKNYIYSVGE